MTFGGVERESEVWPKFCFSDISQETQHTPCKEFTNLGYLVCSGLAYLDSTKIKWNGMGFSREKQMRVLPWATCTFSDVGLCVETWLIPHTMETERLEDQSR